MGKSNLERTRTGERPPTTGKGHGTDALGPSDRSDTGSDITGGDENVDNDSHSTERARSGNAPPRRRRPARPQFGIRRGSRR